MVKDVIKGIASLIWAIITLLISVLFTGITIIFYWIVSILIILIAFPGAIIKTIKQMKNKEKENI